MPVSFRPGDFVEGGAVPIDRNLLWKECRFANFDYVRKDGTVVASTVSAKIVYQDDDGTEYTQHYSAGDPNRFQPSGDGKTLEAITAVQDLSKSSNFYLLISSLINAGYPENRITKDISLLDGLYAHHIGLPEPKRVGLVRQEAEGARERVISVPDRVIRLPGEGKGKAATKTTAVVADTDEGEDEAVTAKALAFVASHLDGDGNTTRQKLAVAVFKDLAKDPDKDAVAGAIFSPEFAATLLANGYVVAGETISRA